MNLNDTVTVTLTKRGARKLNIYYAIDMYREGHSYTGPLWWMFEFFGNSCTFPSDPVFTNLRLS